MTQGLVTATHARIAADAISLISSLVHHVWTLKQISHFQTTNKLKAMAVYQRVKKWKISPRASSGRTEGLRKTASRSDKLMTEVDSSAARSATSRESSTTHALSKDQKKAAKDQSDTTYDECLRPELRDRAEVIGSSVRWFAGWCLRFIIMGVAAYVASLVFAKLWSGILPVLLSLIVCTVLWLLYALCVSLRSRMA